MTNIIFKDARKFVEISLPSFPGSKVVLYDGLLFGQMKKVGEAKEDFDKGILVLTFLIKEWNFTNDKDEILSVDEDNLNQFPLADLQLLMEKSGKILENISKKKVESSKEQ